MLLLLYPAGSIFSPTNSKDAVNGLVLGVSNGLDGSKQMEHNPDKTEVLWVSRKAD